ncbi:hypothetical protein BC830DRAFT_1166434 [Chytriomyces sp. MP71]|nr:hypothetical protein BC830DRAFT_1166434 [Chytriomyces sp. MP71]
MLSKGADADELTFTFNCDACAKDVTHAARMRCAQCKGPDGDPLDLCVPCFAAGAEPRGHSRTHPYLVKVGALVSGWWLWLGVWEGLDWPLFDPQWTAKEELLLVDGLKLYGIGNYEQISQHIGTKSKEEIDAHYRTCYCASERWPLPNMNIQFDKMTTRRYVERDPNQSLRKPERSCTSGPTNHEIQGYMPGRDEFDHEFDHEAENPVKDMIFEDNESPEEVSLKTTMLNIYNVILDRRMERKKFLKDRGLVHDFRKLQNQEKKRTKEERDLLNRIRVFAKLQTASDFEDLTEGLLREQKLRQRIAELQEWRRMGVTSYKEATDYEREKLQRASYKAAGLSGKYGGRPPPPQNRGVAASLGRMNSTGGLHSAGGLTLPGGLNRPKTSSNALDISMADGVDLLLPNEQQLCSNLRILPRAYQVIKETLLRHYVEKGELSRREARSLIKIDVNKTQQIYDLFVVNGWIQFHL